MKKCKIISLVLALLILLSSVSTAALAADSANQGDEKWADNVTVTKISNPDRGEREVDGLIEGGDRENSYTWRLAMYGDEIYIATTRNIASALVNMYGGAFAEAGISLDMFWALINVVTNGDIPRNDANEGANIISYNRKTGEFKVVYTAESGDYFRMAVTFGDAVYFGSYSANPANAQYILKLDPATGEFQKVFQTMNSVSLRANCEYDGHLFFAGADDRTPVYEDEAAPVAKMAIIRKSNEDDTVWERVADFRDFGTTAYDPIHESWAGAPIWELATHNDYIYATAPTHSGFVIYKGHPAAEGETANAYGWYWEEVAGPTNGINNPGLSDVEGGEPGTMRSLIGSVYEFKGELYAYNFDHSFGGEASAFAGFLQQVAGQDVKAHDYLFYLYNSLQNPQKVWKLNDETGKFEECEGFTKLTEDTTNEYVWRMGEHNGKLYISTMDAGIFYNYLTQLTNGNFLNMSAQERLQQIGYIGNLIKLIAGSKYNESLAKLTEKLEQLKAILESCEPDEQIDEETMQEIQDMMALMDELEAYMDQLLINFETMDIDEFIAYIMGEQEEEQKPEDGEIAPTGASADLAETAIRLLPKEYVSYMAEQIKTAVKNGYDSVKNTLAEQIKAAVTSAVSAVKAKLEEISSKIDWEGVEMYLEINEMVRENDWGFDLFRTEDGESFEVITRDGFHDKYNYGCSAFLSTEEGLYIGTCNPFYGGQLYLLTEDAPAYVVGDVDGDGEVTIFDATAIQRYLAGTELDNFNADAADFDGDGEISIFDVTMIQRHLAGMDD